MNPKAVVSALLETDDIGDWLDQTIQNCYPTQALTCPCCEADLRESRSVSRAYRRVWQSFKEYTTGHYDQTTGKYVLEWPADFNPANTYLFSDSDMCSKCDSKLDKPGPRRTPEVDESEVNPSDDPESFLADLPPAEQMLTQRLQQHGFQRHVNTDDEYDKYGSYSGADDDEDEDIVMLEPDPEDITWRKSVSTRAFYMRDQTVSVVVANSSHSIYARRSNVWIDDIQGRLAVDCVRYVTFAEAVRKGIEIAEKLERNELIFGIHGKLRERTPQDP
jgi:hypothetical protein